MSSILENFIYGKSDKHSHIVSFAKTICIAQILFACNACKQKGISILTVFIYYFELIFRKTTVYYTSINSANICKEIDKNTIYRLIHNSSVLWEKLLSLSAKALIEIVSKLKTKNPIFSLIADETIFERTRSQKTELMSRVFDHNENIFKNGFRLLTLIWCDGNTQIPLFGTLLASKKAKNVLNPAESTEEGSIEHARRQNAIKTAPDILIDHLNEIVKLKIPAQYILFDAWFSFPSLIYKIVSNFKFYIVSRLKNNKIKYIYNSQFKTIKELYKESKKRRGKSKYLLSLVVQLNYNDTLIDIKLLFIRNKYNTKDYIVLMSTNLNLSEDEIVRLYSRRWNIETMFKMCKSTLKLEKGTQCTSYDGLTAHITITFMRYMFLSYFKRCEDDPRTLGALFFSIHDDLQETSFEEVYRDILDVFSSIMSKNLIDKFSKTKEEVEELISLVNCEMNLYMQKVLQKRYGGETVPRSLFFRDVPVLSNT